MNSFKFFLLKWSALSVSNGSTGTMSVISAKLVSTLAINAKVPRSNPTIDGYFSTSLEALGKPSRLL